MKFLVFLASAFVATMLYAQAATVDGVIGAEWNGVTPKVVTYDALAPTSNFATPGPSNHLVAYRSYIRADQNYVYGAFQALPSGTDSWDSAVAQGVGTLVNLYIDTNPSTGSDLGFEINNNRAFKPGFAGYYDNISSFGILRATNTAVGYPGAIGGVLEIAIPWTYLSTDPQNIGFPRISAVNPAVQWRLLQAFGYSVSGGSSFGDDRLGTVSAPAGVFAPIVAAPILSWHGVLVLTLTLLIAASAAISSNAGKTDSVRGTSANL
jgi:hypothetical protein